MSEEIRSKSIIGGHLLHGRRKIMTSVDAITEDNLIDVLEKAMIVHLQNKSDIDYLYNYYKGDQPIIRRIKEIRPDICNNIVINRANEIVSFKVGYQFGIPMQYTASKTEDGISAAIEELNNLMSYENKAKKDKELGEWQMICGTAFRIALPDTDLSPEEDEAPFEINNLRPNSTFVIYSNKIGEKPMAGVTYWNNADWTGDGDTNVSALTGLTFGIYTKDMYYEVNGGKITVRRPNTLRIIPIIEYPLNSARLGAFEIVIDILDALSTIESNRLDGLEQFVQAFIKFVNCDISDEDLDKFIAKGAIKVFSHEGKNADVSMVTSELSQTQTQTYVDDLYDAILTICGIPNRNGGSSTSDTGAAVQMRDGFTAAESRAKDAEVMFEASEREMLKIILKILRDKNILTLKVSDVKMVFPRRNYENIQSKVQALVTMLDNPWIDRKDAYAHSGLFTDPETASDNGIRWHDEQEAKYTVQDVGDEDAYVSGSGQEA